MAAEWAGAGGGGVRVFPPGDAGCRGMPEWLLEECRLGGITGIPRGRAGENGVDAGEQIQRGLLIALEDVAEFGSPFVRGAALFLREQQGGLGEAAAGRQAAAGAAQPGLKISTV